MTEAQAIRSALCPTDQTVGLKGVSLVELHLNQGTTESVPPPALKPGQHPPSSIIFNGDGTVSGRAQYAPSGELPVPPKPQLPPTPELQVQNAPIGGQLDDLVYYTSDRQPPPKLYSI